MTIASAGLPDGWTASTLGEVGTYVNGRAFKTSEWGKTGRPIIRIQDLTGSSRNPNYYDGNADERHVVHSGDLLISWSATLGAYIWAGPEAVLNQHIFKVISKIDREFHYHLVRNAIQELERKAHGSGMVHVTKGMFESTPVLLPPADEQRRIADWLDEIDARHALIGNRLSAARTLVDRLRAAVLAAACSGRMTTDLRDGDVGAGLHATEVSDGSIDLHLPEFPAGYTVTTVGGVSERIEYGTSKKADTEGDVPVLRMGNIQDGSLDMNNLKYLPRDAEIERLLLEDGDLLFNRTNSPDLVGKTAVFHGPEPTTFASYLIRVRFRTDLIKPDFVAMWLNSAWGRAWARHVKTDGVSQSNINGKKLAAMPVPMPPIEEQREIVARATAALASADRLDDAIEAAASATERAARSALAKACRGEFASRIEFESASA